MNTEGTLYKVYHRFQQRILCVVQKNTETNCNKIPKINVIILMTLKMVPYTGGWTSPDHLKKVEEEDSEKMNK